LLDLNGVRWHATMNSANANNAPYMHNSLVADDGATCPCTEVFLRLGVAEKAQLEFELTRPNTFRLLRVADKGRWRPGNELHERTSRGASFISRASPVPPAPAAASGARATSFPFDKRDEILRFADLYWKLISSTEAAEERAFEKELPIARTQGFLTKSLFVRLGCWKSKRPRARYESNDEAVIRDATARAFTATDEAKRPRSRFLRNFMALRCGRRRQFYTGCDPTHFQ
jgi:hypothetical protein